MPMSEPTIRYQIFKEKLKIQSKLVKTEKFDNCFCIFLSANAKSLFLYGTLDTRPLLHAVLRFS